jgi:hypothetical protein
MLKATIKQLERQNSDMRGLMHGKDRIKGIETEKFYK